MDVWKMKPWKPGPAQEPNREYQFENGDQLLVVVQVLQRHQPQSPPFARYDEYSVVTVDCDEHYFKLRLGDAIWGWDWSDVEAFIPMKDVTTRLAAALEPVSQSTGNERLEERRLIVEAAWQLAEHYRKGDPEQCDKATLFAIGFVLDKFADAIESGKHIERANRISSAALSPANGGA